jgi:DNA helicase-2/ATP-dependent DNA helicase PcrA
LPRKKDPANFSILDEEFVRNKYLAQPLSVTHLNNYLDCPWKYFFVNLIRIPQAQTKHQMYGTAVHAVLRTFFNAYKEDRTLENKEIIDLFQHALEMQPLSEDDRRESFEKGKKALTGYFEQYDATWPERLLTEYSASSSIDIVLDDLKKEKVCLELTGKLDKIEFIDDHNVNVVDYKTGKPKSRNDIEGKTKTADGNYKRQLVFYKILLSGEDRKRGFDMLQGEIDFIEPNERGVYKKEKFDIAREEVETVTTEITDMANDIISLGFKERTCKDKDCEYCKLGAIIKR